MFACVVLERSSRGPSPGVAATPLANEVVVGFAREWAPRVELVRPGVVVLDAGGLTRLFGTPEAWACQLVEAARARAWHAQVAVARTRMVALLVGLHLGRAGAPDVVVVPPGHERNALASLPLTLLADLDIAEAEGRLSSTPARRVEAAVRRARLAAEGMLDILGRWGLHTLGELAALPAADVAARLGAHGRRWHERVSGYDPQPLVDDPEPHDFDATLDLEWPVDGLEPLSFVLGRLLEPLCARLQHDQRGAVVVYTRLDLVTRASHLRTLQLPAPMADPKGLRTLILLDLEAHPPEAGIDRVHVHLEPAPSRRLQFSLLHRPLPAPDRVASLMARLNALMGEGRCGTPVLPDTHRPGAFVMAPFAPGTPGCSAGRTRGGRLPTGPRHGHEVPVTSHEFGDIHDLGNPHAVLRRFRPPVPIRVVLREGRPAHLGTGTTTLPGGAVAGCAGPWRTSGAWWRVRAGPWNRDEWDVAVHQGPVYRLSRALVEDRWVIEGVWD